MGGGFPTAGTSVSISGGSVTVPGVSTEAKQDDGNATLDSILTKIGDGSGAIQIKGQHQNGVTSDAVNINAFNALNIALTEPVSLFGDITSVEQTPRVQIDAVYGIVATDVETLTDGASGSATAANSLFSVSTGTSVGGYGVLRSRRVIKHRPGQACRMDFAGRFSTPAALSLQAIGGFTATEGLFFCYSGTTFGVMRRAPGAVAIWRLTVTVGAGGVETLTVRLDGVNFTVAAGGALSTAATAQLIAARVGGYTGWSSVVSPTSNGSTVTFLQGSPAATVGTFTLTSTGTAAGTFAELQAGAANDLAVGFVAQTAWNVDRLDGSNGAFNPSGMLLDPTKLNIFQISYALGASVIRFRVMTPIGRFVTVHIIQNPNSLTALPMKNPSLRVGYIAASLGSTTNLTVQGGTAAGFVQGMWKNRRDPIGISVPYTATTSESVALLIRNRAEFASTVNQRQFLPHRVVVGIETANRLIRLRCVLNPTLSTTANWQYINQSQSSTEYAAPTGLTITGGTVVAESSPATGSPTTINLDDLDLRMEPGDVLAIAVTAASSTAVANIAINGQED